MSDFENVLRIYQDRVNQSLNNNLPAGNGSNLVDAVRYSVLNGGKRLRSILVYLGSELGQPSTKDTDLTACAVEFVHCYSLIHDDLPAMDNDDLRRGKPTCHIEYGEATAILAGDALQPMAYELICAIEGVSDSIKINMVKKLAVACSVDGMVEGQMKDIQSGKEFSLEDLDLMHEQKTGRLIQTSLELGGMLAGVNQKDLEILKLYGQKIGLAFQIKDDIIDIESTSNESGKPQGSDILNNKLTYPSLVGVQKSKDRAQQLASEACEILRPMTLNTKNLRFLASYLVNRDY
jgi:geranylgeranyl pyrophosphate synthase